MLSMKSPIVGGRVIFLLAAAGAALIASTASGQTDKSAGLTAPDASDVVAATSHRSTLGRMFRRLTTNFNENKLEDVIKFIEDYTGATIEVYWADSNGEGLNREQLITLNVKNLPVLTVLERVLAKASTDSLSGGSTWQMTEYGAIEIGPKSVLNRNKRTELYDIHDLLIELPRYDEVPQIDLQSLLQQSQQGGGGGGQSPFTNDQNQNQGRDPDLLTPEQKGDQVMKLITTLVEPEEWVDGGGEGGTIRYYNGNLLVNAPDYMHRQINGYTYWPATSSKYVGGRRYVSLNMDNSIGTIDGFAEYPVSAIVGGRPVSSDPGGSQAPAPGGKPNGPGGSKAPAAKQPAAKQPAGKPATGEPSGKQAPTPPAAPAKQPAKKDQKK
jgi:hypothetical protein